MFCAFMDQLFEEIEMFESEDWYVWRIKDNLSKKEG